MNIGYRIKIKRREQSLTLEELSKKIGVSRQTLSRYETGVISNIPSDKIELLAEALQTTPSYLMGWEENDSHKEKPAIVTDDELSPQKKYLVEKIRQMDDQQLAALDALIDSVYRMRNQSNK